MYMYWCHNIKQCISQIYRWFKILKSKEALVSENFKQYTPVIEGSLFNVSTYFQDAIILCRITIKSIC